MIFREGNLTTLTRILATHRGSGPVEVAPGQWTATAAGGRVVTAATLAALEQQLDDAACASRSRSG